MPIKTICKGCDATFQLKDELAGKKGKCPNCGELMQVPSLEDKTNDVTENTKASVNKGKDGIFSHDIYGIKQKKIAINEKYFIKDKDDNLLLFSIRKAYVMRGLLSALTFIFTVIAFIYLAVTTAGIDNTIMFATIIIIGIFLAIFLAIFVSPKQHIKFHRDDKNLKGTPEFQIKEDSKFQMVNKTYTMVNENKEVICVFRKNIFTDIIRKKWHMDFDKKHVIVQEDSIILGLLRRFAPFGNLIRTNFVFTDAESKDNLGIFKRKFELFDNYSLDLSNDTAYRVPRQLSLGMAILLDTGEKR